MRESMEFLRRLHAPWAGREYSCPDCRKVTRARKHVKELFCPACGLSASELVLARWDGDLYGPTWLKESWAEVHQYVSVFPGGLILVHWPKGELYRVEIHRPGEKHLELCGTWVYDHVALALHEAMCWQPGRDLKNWRIERGPVLPTLTDEEVAALWKDKPVSPLPRVRVARAAG